MPFHFHPKEPKRDIAEDCRVTLNALRHELAKSGPVENDNPREWETLEQMSRADLFALEDMASECLKVLQRHQRTA